MSQPSINHVWSSILEGNTDHSRVEAVRWSSTVNAHWYNSPTDNTTRCKHRSAALWSRTARSGLITLAIQARLHYGGRLVLVYVPNAAQVAIHRCGLRTIMVSKSDELLSALRCRPLILL